VRAKVEMDFTYKDKYSAPMASEKIKILGAILELPAKQQGRFWPIWTSFEVHGLDWQCSLAGM
jgi:hypothetical protein